MKISDLDADGNDLIELGLSGREIGSALDRILEAVISEEIINNREEILKYVRDVVL